MSVPFLSIDFFRFWFIIFLYGGEKMRFGEKILYDKQAKAVLKIFRSTVEAGKRSYREHHHTECEISLLLSGSGIYSLPEKSYDFEKNDVFLFSSDEVHCLTDIKEGEEFVLLNLHFEPRILWLDRSLFEAEGLIRIFSDRNGNFQNRIDRENPATQNIARHLLEIEKELSERRENYQSAAKMHLCSILISLLRDYDYTNKSADLSSSRIALSRLGNVMQYIDDNIGEPLSLDDLADLASMNKSYFSTFFKKYNGISPWDYICIKRVEKAIEMLKDTSLSKLEIAQSCGFNSMSNFYSQFRKITGKVPSDYSAD